MDRVTWPPRAGLRDGAPGRAVPGALNLATLSFGLFIATNATCLWGGLFPFLPAEFRASPLVSGFYLAVTLASTATYLACSQLSLRMPRARRPRRPVSRAVVVYLAGWALVIAAAYVHGLTRALAVTGGAFLGAGVSLFYLLWQELFASMESREGDQGLLVGTALGSLMYFALMLLPSTVTAFLIPLVMLPLFTLGLVLCRRGMDLEQPMFQDEPAENTKVYRRVSAELWQGVMCVGGLGFCAGIMRSLSVMHADVGMLVNVVSMGAALAALSAMLAWWSRHGLMVSVARLYRAAFPLLITWFLLMPLLGSVQTRWMAGVLYALYNLASVLMAVRCAQVSRESGADPVYVFGMSAMTSTLLNNVGFIVGSFSETVTLREIPALTATALVSCYLLAIIYYFGTAFRKGHGTEREADGVELVGPARGRVPGAEDAAGQPAPAPLAGEDIDRTPPGRGGRFADEAADRPYKDRVSKQVEALRLAYGLSTRETEVMELIVRGNSVPRISEELVVSENTIRTHAKRIYKKLDVHKRQELLDLVDSFRPVEG